MLITTFVCEFIAREGGLSVRTKRSPSTCAELDRPCVSSASREGLEVLSIISQSEMVLPRGDGEGRAGEGGDADCGQQLDL